MKTISPTHIMYLVDTDQIYYYVSHTQFLKSISLGKYE